MNLRSKILYSLVCLIWGTTWLVIKFQINSTSAVAGVFYRFLFASLIMLGINIFLKNNLKYPLKNHLFFALQGIFNFSINYILTYQSEKFVNSAYVAIAFTALIYYNMLGMSVFYKKKIELKSIIGSFIGLVGILILFSKEIFYSHLNQNAVIGILLSLVATLCASFGNMASIKNHRENIPVLVLNNWAMFYGCLFSLILGFVRNDSFQILHSLSFYASLFYLAFFGTVIAFYAYQTLLKEIGAYNIAYTSIVSTIIAVFISVLYEGLNLRRDMIIGLILALIGNYIMLMPAKNLHKLKNHF